MTDTNWNRYEDIWRWHHIFGSVYMLSIGDLWPVEEVIKNIFSTNNMFHSIIPTFGIRARAALSCVGGKNAGGYGCYRGVQCRPLYTVYIACALILIKFLPVISSIITCTYPFTVDDNHLQKSTIQSKFSDIPLYTPQQSLHQLEFDQLCLKIWPWNHMELLRFRASILYLCS